MAKIVDNSLPWSISRKLPAEIEELRPGRRLFPSNNYKLTTTKLGIVYSAQSDVQTKESLKTAVRPQNGPTILRSDNGREGDAVLCLRATITIRKKRLVESDGKTADFMDVVADLLGQSVALQLVSVDIDPVTGVGKRSQVSGIKDWADRALAVADKVQYTAEFVIAKSFGIPGAFIVTNRHQNEFFLESVSLQGHPLGTVHFPIHSWVHPEQDNPAPLVFFSNQVYLPSSTPKGLQDLRKEDLQASRGDGKGMRQEWENVYDYDVYNDLCDVDTDKTLARPILGGSKEYQYPRRNRTGRPPAKTDSRRESRLAGQTIPYVPRDEVFQPIKQESYMSTALRGLVQQRVPDLRDHFRGSPDEFDGFDEISQLYCDGVQIKKKSDMVRNVLDTLRGLPVFPMLPDTVQVLVDAVADQPTNVFRYPQPQLLARDIFAWSRDAEFGRQTLAGLHPCAIERLKEFPPVSALDNPELYGPRESAIKRDHISNSLDGLSIEKALEKKRLFILDYHDIFMPFINEINSQEGRKGYATRTLFFLTAEGILTPVAIELSLPSPHLSRQVLVPGDTSTQQWLWKLAKAHVSCNDAGYHQLASHWLRTHAIVEPYVIAANRQLSQLHPILKLLQPHFRYTMEINAAARQSLISAGGVIEKSFLPGQFAMEMSSAIYGAKWRFVDEALPQELISRGVAEEDPTSPTGVNLLIEDYPYANDGLLVWTAIKSFVSDYVSIYYQNSTSIEQDEELQQWWEEIRTRGHADKKDEEWWPQLETQKDLIRILTTMIWATSGLHAAVNFGQYDYAGYMPNKPSLMRRHIPQSGTPEYNEFQANPELFFLSSLPSQLQTTVLMAVLESLSTHSPDEEYLGSDTYPNWFGCPEAVNAYAVFQDKIKEVEQEIHMRNANPQLRNRHGAGTLPYELLLPWSRPGITARGIPKSISI
ncbi:unnamed protein product [Calypogeia fissa]